MMNSNINDADKSSVFLATSPDNMNSTNPYSYPGAPTPGTPSGNSIPPPYSYPQPGNPYPYNNQQSPAAGFLPQPQQPQPYPQIQPNNSANDAIMATQALNTAIHQNGRTPITVVCPSCRNTIITEITEVENTTVAQGQSKAIYICLGGTIIVIIAFFIAGAAISGSFIPLAVMPIFLIFPGAGYFLMRSAGRNAARMCTDIQHHCSSCKVLLGVSSGAQFYQQMQMRTMDHRRRL